LTAPQTVGIPIAGSQIAVVTRDGQVIVLDTATGTTRAAVQLPAGIRSPPTISGGKYIVAADSLFCFALDAGDLSPESAVYLGHGPASVTISPVALPQHTLIVENRGASTAALHVLDGAGVVQELTLAGNVPAVPAVIGSRLVVPTGGGMTVFDITPDAKAPLKKAAEQAVAAAYVAERSGKLLVGGTGLQQCELALSGRSLEVKPLWAAFSTSVCTSPPQGSPDAVFFVRREPQSAGAIAAAVRAANGQPLWETRLSPAEAAP
jgi:hypothetical protein